MFYIGEMSFDLKLISSFAFGFHFEYVVNRETTVKSLTRLLGLV